MNDIFKFISRSVLALVGVGLTSVCAILFLSMVAIEEFGALGHGVGPYAGIIAYLLLPAIFVVGLILIPIGAWRTRRRDRRRIAAGQQSIQAPVVDLNQPRTRAIVLLIGVLTAVNVVIIATATYKGVEVMESSEFCGGACHTVMSPQYEAYKRSPHARVRCTQCHIGPGANWFVKSKLSGSWQLISVALDLFPRPIPTPVENLRPARETCEQCHWPSKFVGDRLKIITHYDEDERQTEKKTVLLIKVGGIQAGTGRGIHWHVDPRNVVRYRSDKKRQHIYDVELTTDGVTRLYKAKEAPPAGAPQEPDWRTMDCVDCHNRPTHAYPQPRDEIDRVLSSGELDRTLPYIKREGVRIVQLKFASHDEAGRGIRKELVDFYSQQYPDLFKNEAQRVEEAAKKLFEIYRVNVSPEMKIDWGTYVNFQLNHDGCFRCHNADHQTEDGKRISKKCDTCHEALAEGETAPEILDILYP